MTDATSTTTSKEQSVQHGHAPYRNLYIIVNPAAGRDEPILGLFNSTFNKANVNWELKLTKKSGDGYALAQEAVAAGADAVAVYGGDGTVMEVANGLSGTGVPLAIFPGGTANVMSVELGIPGDLALATALICGQDSYERTVDLGKVGDRYFLLRVGIGFEADMMNNADQETKNRVGKLAYIVSGLQTLTQRQVARYHLVCDGEEIEADGVTCMIANSGNIGLPGLNLSRNIDVSDGLLDVLIVRDTDIGSLLSVAASTIGLREPLQHWQCKQVKVTADPPQAVICDGEPLDPTPVSAEIVPGALRVIVPKAALSGSEQAQANQNSGG